MVATELLEPYLENAGDGIKTKRLPISVIQYVAKPDDIKINSVNAPSYKATKVQMQEDFLMHF